MNALALLSNILSPRKLVDPPPLPQPVETSNDRLATELAANMQHQEQLKEQVGVLQQRVVDAETTLLKQRELLGETERNIEEF